MILLNSGNEPKNDFQNFLHDYAWLVAVIVAVIVVLVIVLIFAINHKKTKPIKKKQKLLDVDSWVKALGDGDNILEIDSNGSRIVIKVKNKEIINREELTKLGVKSAIIMSNKLTLVTDLDNQIIVEKIKNSLQK